MSISRAINSASARRIAFADDVGVELKVLSQPALLLALVAKELRQGKPLDRLLVTPLVRGDHAGQGGSHLRTKRHLALAFVAEVVELADDFLAALGGKQFQGFQRRAVVFPEPVAARRRAPLLEDELARLRAPQVRLGQRLGVKITKPGQTFHNALQSRSALRSWPGGRAV